MKNVKEIQLENVIQKWNEVCNMNIPSESFQRIGDDVSPIYSIKISTNVSFAISKEDKLYFRIVFSGYLTYKKFELNEAQFDELISNHEKAIFEKEAKEKADLIEKCEGEFDMFMQTEKGKAIFESLMIGA